MLCMLLFQELNSKGHLEREPPSCMWHLGFMSTKKRKGVSAELLWLDKERPSNKSVKQKEQRLTDAVSQEGLLAVRLSSLK